MQSNYSTGHFPWNMDNDLFYDFVSSLQSKSIEDGDEQAIYDICMIYGIVDTERAEYVSGVIGEIANSKHSEKLNLVISKLPFEVESQVQSAISLYESND